MATAARDRRTFPHSSDGSRLFDEVEEGAERYCPGGLHPVSLGDVYESSRARYKIIHTLGWRSYSTVWLASMLDQHGTALRQYRALKFRRSDASGRGMEREVLRTIATSSSNHPGRDYVVRLFDDFEVCGPNGKHEVLVVEVTGPPLETMMRSCYYPGTPDPYRLPATLIRRVARQLLLALAYLANERIVHGGTKKNFFCDVLLTFARHGECVVTHDSLRLDLYLNNLTIAVKNLDGRAEEDVVGLFGELYTNDIDCYNPAMARYVGLTIPTQIVSSGSIVREFVKDERLVHTALDLRLVDFGQAVSSDRLSSYSLHTPNVFRAPELQALGHPSGANPFAVDVWAAGCIIYRLVARRMLFNSDHSNFMWAISRTIGGSRPEYWPESKWAKAEEQPHPNDPARLNDDSYFTEFLRLLLVLDPECRPAVPVDEIIEHAWFSPTSPLGVAP